MTESGEGHSSSLIKKPPSTKTFYALIVYKEIKSRVESNQVINPFKEFHRLIDNTVAYTDVGTRFTATKQGAWRAIAAWHALYAKSKLVPLTPAGDISVGYYLYKSMKLFKGLITHYDSFICACLYTPALVHCDALQRGVVRFSLLSYFPAVTALEM